MYARLATYRLRVVDEARREQAWDDVQAVKLVASVDGCRGVWAMWPEGSETATDLESRVLSLWDSREEAERLPDVLGPRLAQTLDEAGLAVAAPPSVEILLAEGLVPPAASA